MPEEVKGTGFQIPWWLPLAAGGAAGLGAYGLARLPKFESAKKFPLLRQIQEASKGKMYSTPYDNVDLSKLTPKQRRMRELIRGQEIDINDPKQLKKLKEEGGALWDWTMDDPPPGVLSPALGATKDPKVQDARWDLFKDLENKANEARLLAKHAPGTGPRTMTISDMMYKHNLPELYEDMPREELHRALKQYQTAMKKEFGDYIVKPTSGGAASSGVFPTEKTDLVKEHDLWSNKLKKQFDFEMEASPEMNPVMEKFRKMEGFKGQTIDEMMLDNAIIQERLPLEQWTGRTAEKMRAAGQAPSKEYRLHVVGGKVIPSLATPRYYPKDPRMILEFLKARKAAKWAQKNVIDKLPTDERSLSYALDVAPIQGGGFKVIETNPGAGSGLLDPAKNPFAQHHLHRAITGRHTKPMAAAIGLGTGLGTAGAGYAAKGMLSSRPAPVEKPLEQQND